MPRIAWFTPLAPELGAPTVGASELLVHAGRSHAVDIFVERVAAPGSPRTFAACDFPSKQLRQPYDLTVYEIADTSRHGFLWPYLVRHPGLAILYDDRLHHLRGTMLRQLRAQDAYRAEMAYCHPDADPAIAELGCQGLLGAAVDLWPMRRIVLTSSRLVVVPSVWQAATLRKEAAHDRVRVVPPGVALPSGGDRHGFRDAHGIAADAIVLGTFGRIGPQRRITAILEAVAARCERNLHVLACGQLDPGYDPLADARAHGIGDRFTLVAVTDDRAWMRGLPAADIALCLAWTDDAEALAVWVTCLTAGLPTIATDRADWVDIPTLDARNWKLQHARGPDSQNAHQPETPAAVHIDILDESHSLRNAIRRLVADAELRETLAQAGAALARERFGIERRAAAFDRAIAEALAVPAAAARPSDLPAHLLADGSAGGRSLLAPFGVQYALGP